MHMYAHTSKSKHVYRLQSMLLMLSARWSARAQRMATRVLGSARSRETVAEDCLCFQREALCVLAAAVCAGLAATEV